MQGNSNRTYNPVNAEESYFASSGNRIASIHFVSNDNDIYDEDHVYDNAADSDREFLCTGYLPEGRKVPETMTCNALEDDSIQSSNYTEASDYLVEASSKCDNKVGTQEFSACITQGTTIEDLIDQLLDNADGWIDQFGEKYAEQLCSSQKCSKAGRCSLFNWHYFINHKGIVSDPACPQGLYVVEVIVVAECRCRPRKCGKTKFIRPIVLESTLCPINGVSVEATCAQSSQNLITSINQLALSFCKGSICQDKNRQCGLRKVDHSKIKCERIGVNGKICCRCTVEVYGVTCACVNSAP